MRIFSRRDSGIYTRLKDYLIAAEQYTLLSLSDLYRLTGHSKPTLKKHLEKMRGDVEVQKYLKFYAKGKMILVLRK